MGGEGGGWGVWGVWVCVRVRVIALLPGRRPGVCVIAMRPACAHALLCSILDPKVESFGLALRVEILGWHEISECGSGTPLVEHFPLDLNI